MPNLVFLSLHQNTGWVVFSRKNMFSMLLDLTRFQTYPEEDLIKGRKKLPKNKFLTLKTFFILFSMPKTLFYTQ